MWAMKEIHMTDEHAVTSMVEAARDGDAAAWNRLVERYLPLVVAVAGRYRLNADEVADVSQTLWLRLVEHLDEIREPRALPGWIVTTTRNEAFRLIKTRNRTLSIDPLSDWEPYGEDDRELDEQLLQDERHQALREGLHELPPHQRRLLLLLLVDPPLSYDQISHQLGIPKGSIGPTRARCLEHLRRTEAMRPFVSITAAVATRR